MNIFSNIGITELIFILLLALLVVGPERLPELARQIGKLLRDVRKAYENLTRDLGPEFMSIQQTTQELRESVESVRSIPKDVVQSVVSAAELDGTIQELKGVTKDVSQLGQALSDAKRSALEAERLATEKLAWMKQADALAKRAQSIQQEVARVPDAQVGKEIRAALAELRAGVATACPIR